MKIEVRDAPYKLRNGGKAWIHKADTGEPSFHGYYIDVNGTAYCSYWTSSGAAGFSGHRAEDIVSDWHEPEKPETLNVADMWVIVDHYPDGSMAVSHPHTSKPLPLSSAVSILRVRDWEAVKRGEREFVIGEGLI